MSELTARNIVHRAIVNACPVGVVRKENELRVRVDKLLDEPRTGDSIDLNSFSGNPLHTKTSLPSSWLSSSLHPPGGSILLFRRAAEAALHIVRSFALLRVGRSRGHCVGSLQRVL